MWYSVVILEADRDVNAGYIWSHSSQFARARARRYQGRQNIAVSPTPRLTAELLDKYDVIKVKR